MPIGARLGASLPQVGGPALVGAAVLVFEALRPLGVGIPNPPAILVCLVVYCAFTGGYLPGFAGAALALAYIAWFFSLAGRPFQYSQENLVRVLVWAITVPLMVWMIGRLKRGLVRHAEQPQRLIEAAPNGMLMVDRQGRIALVNRQVEAVFGYARAELIGQPVEILLPERFRGGHPGHREGYFADPRTRAMGAGRDLFGVGKNGREVPIEIGLNPIVTGDGPFVLASIIDITERQRAEAASRELNAALARQAEELASLNASLDQQVAARTAELQGEIDARRRLEAQREGERSLLEALAQGESLPAFLTRLALGYEARYPGMLASVLLLDADGRRLTHGAAPHLPTAYSRAIDGVEIGPDVGSCGTAAYTGTMTMVADIASDPLWRDYKELALAHGLMACWSVPILSTQGRVLGTFALYYGEPRAAQPDEVAALERGAYLASLAIERARAETALRQLNAELEQRVASRTAQLAAKNDELKAFAYTVSHDLKAPLRGIAGYAQELERRHQAGLGERAQFCVSQIITATRNLDRLIEDLLRYSRLEAETPTLTEIDVPGMVAGILRDRGHTLQELGVEVSVAIPFASARGWERGLHQVLTNLIDNAVKYSRQARPPRLRIEGEERPGGWRLTVADNGIGFDMKYHDRIFGLFNRLVRADEFEGTGAGLAIVKRLLDKQGGRIWAESAPGQGATFVVEWPGPDR